MPTDHLESIIKTTFLSPSPDCKSLGKSWRMCFPRQFPGGAHTAGPSENVERVPAKWAEVVCNVVIRGWPTELPVGKWMTHSARIQLNKGWNTRCHGQCKDWRQQSIPEKCALSHSQPWVQISAPPQPGWRSGSGFPSLPDNVFVYELSNTKPNSILKEVMPTRELGSGASTPLASNDSRKSPHLCCLTARSLNKGQDWY